MRADMAKVLVERPRPGSRDGSRPRKGYRKLLRKALDSGDPPPAREGIKARSGGTRFFNEHLGPLRRFLDSNVGRPWDKVYSEICARVDRGNVVQKHILTHLFEYVVTNVVLIDGEPCRGDGEYGGYGRPLRDGYSRNRWYVCPNSGLLRRVRRAAPRQRRAGPTLPAYVTVNDRVQCRWCGDGWELVELAPLPVGPSRDRSTARDVVLDRAVCGMTDYLARTTYGKLVYAVSRQRLARKELKNYPIPMDYWSAHRDHPAGTGSGC
jgi:hypothetical protein